MLTPADNTSNFYKLIKKNCYITLLPKLTTKASPNCEKSIMKQGKKISKKKDILNRIQVNGKKERFITLKDHKLNFESNTTTSLKNPAKDETWRLSNAIIENMNKQLRNTLLLHQWINTRKIDWFKNIQNNKLKFMIFDIW